MPTVTYLQRSLLSGTVLETCLLLFLSLQGLPSLHVTSALLPYPINAQHSECALSRVQLVSLGSSTRNVLYMQETKNSHTGLLQVTGTPERQMVMMWLPPCSLLSPAKRNGGRLSENENRPWMRLVAVILSASYREKEEKKDLLCS